MDKIDLLEQIKADILSQNICPNLAKTAKSLVMGDGNPEANVVIIGEAPGKKEDEQGIPFIGAAGKFLNEMLAGIGYERQDMYITNIVKYRPPDNRDPSPSEKQAFLPFLIRQLEIIQPKVVLTLGRHSMEYFLPHAKISEVHGVPQQIMIGSASVVLIPLYHPAVALYNGGLRKTLIKDFNQIPTIINELQRNN